MKTFTLNLEFSGNWAIFYFYCSLGKVLTKPRGFYCCSPAPPQSYFLFLCDLSLFVFGGFLWFFFLFYPFWLLVLGLFYGRNFPGSCFPWNLWSQAGSRTGRRRDGSSWGMDWIFHQIFPQVPLRFVALKVIKSLRDFRAWQAEGKQFPAKDPSPPRLWIINYKL